MDELDSFLKEGTQPRVDGGQEPVQPSAEKAAPDASPAESKAPEAAPEPAAKASETKAEPEDEEVAPHAGSDNRTVPFSALEKVRNDWKSKYAAEQARAELLAKQLEEAKRPPPAPSAPPPQDNNVVTLPDFNTDPRGFVVGMAIQHQRELVNERLNISQALLTDKIGEEKVQQYVADFKAFAEQDETLYKQLYNQAMPYQWMTREVDRRRMHREIGDDPSAFEARIREKVLAEIAAAGGNGEAAAAPRGPGLPAQPPSLAGARSVAGRSSPTFSGPPPLEDLFPGAENRRRAR